MKLFYTQEEKQKKAHKGAKSAKKKKICIVKHKKATQNIDFLIFFNQI